LRSKANRKRNGSKRSLATRRGATTSLFGPVLPKARPNSTHVDLTLRTFKEATVDTVGNGIERRNKAGPKAKDECRNDPTGTLIQIRSFVPGAPSIANSNEYVTLGTKNATLSLLNKLFDFHQSDKLPYDNSYKYTIQSLQW